MRMLVVRRADLASAIRRIRCLRVSIRAVIITCAVLAGLGGFAGGLDEDVAQRAGPAGCYPVWVMNPWR